MIRSELRGDHDAIRRLVAAAFGSTVEAELVDRIRASPEYIAEMALVAELAGEIVGHVIISHTVIRHESGDRQIAMLSPLAVMPDKAAVGRREGTRGRRARRCRTRDEPLVVLEGSPAYYGPLGFEFRGRTTSRSTFLTGRRPRPGKSCS